MTMEGREGGGGDELAMAAFTYLTSDDGELGRK